MTPYDFFASVSEKHIWDRVQKIEGFFASKLGFDGNLYLYEYDGHRADYDGSPFKGNILPCTLEEVISYDFTWSNHRSWTPEPGWYDSLCEQFYAKTDEFYRNKDSSDTFSLSRAPLKFQVTWFKGNGWQSYEITHNFENVYTTWYWLHVDDDDHMLEFMLTEN